TGPVCPHNAPVEAGPVRRAPAACTKASARSKSSQTLSHWKEVTTQITTSNEDVYRLYRQSVEDLAALRLPVADDRQDELLAAAGVPWFVTVFGRDRLVVSLQSMIVYPDFARGTLHSLAELQPTEADHSRGGGAG